MVVWKVFVIVGGVVLGAYFSNRTNNLHNKAELSGWGNVLPYMDHGAIDITNDSIVPEIFKLEIFKDPMAGWNLHLATRNFSFTPENASSLRRQGEGHAHLMINGEKKARLYGHWFHIPSLKPGENEIEVTLNANTHAVLLAHNKVISKIIYQTVEN